MSENLIVMNANSSETRIALLEDGSLAEIFIERRHERGYLGNIYKGKVSRVLPGMQAAFIEIGEDRSAFLYGGDVIDPVEFSRRQQMILEDPGKDFYEVRDEITQTPIEKLLKQGQQITVQVVKEPIGTKGARVSMFLSLPGRYLVLIPNFSHIGISRRIVDEAERNRLKQSIESFKPQGYGVIVRTAAVEASDFILKRDLEYLIHAWEKIQKNMADAKPPALIFREAEIHIKAIRDLYNEDIKRIIVDNEIIHEEVTRFLDATIPGASQKVELYQEPKPLFDAYGIEVDLARALSRKVWLPSGGYLVIDQTEALTSFDVNTGKFVGKLSVRETILKTNLESVSEIASQLRLRNIGGIIVIDFIDMDEQSDRDKVFAAFEEALKGDKAKINVLKISELGLVQMTRKRTSESLERSLTEECAHCSALGHVRSKKTLSLDLLRDIERYCLQTNIKKISVSVRDDIKALLLKEEKELLDDVCARYGVTIDFLPTKITAADLRLEPYEIL